MNYKVYEMQHPLVKEKGKLVVTSPYGSRVDPETKKTSFHAGVDSTLWVGTYGTVGTILAFADGTVKTVWDEETSNTTFKNSAGNHVVIDHGNGCTTRYYHLAKGVTKYVKVGTVVKKGTPIGYMGNTGKSYGAHLHFELKVNGNTVDPLPYMLGEKTIEKKEEPKGDNTMEFKVGDVVSVIGTHYYTGKEVPAWVKAKKWIVSDVSPLFVLVDKSEDGSNAIKSPFYAKDLKLEYREKKENPTKDELKAAYASCNEILQTVNGVKKNLEDLKTKLEKMMGD